MAGGTKWDKRDRVRAGAQMVAAAQRELEEAIADARRPWAKLSYREIGECLGVTGEAVRQRYGHLDPGAKREDQDELALAPASDG